MKNNAHMESKIERLRRLENGEPIEAIETLLNSIHNFFNNEISVTPTQYQTSLLFIGIHAAALTISEALFGKTGEQGFKLFLQKFVDGETKSTQFSLIAHHLHNWRNILAHQWIGSLGHTTEYDYEMAEGWKMSKDILKINPAAYCSQYLNAFRGKIWHYDKILNKSELQAAKGRIIAKYKNR